MLSGPARAVQELARWWYGLMGWLPGPFQVLSFIIAMSVAVRLFLKHALPPLTGAAVPWCRLALRTVAWALVAPEFVITGRVVATGRPVPRALHGYGEVVAGALEAAEKGAAGLLAWMSRAPKIAAGASLWTPPLAIVVVNAASYQAARPLPLATWWDSVEVWVSALG